MGLVRLIFAAGVAAVALAGFLSPWPFIGWLPIGAGLCWAAYDLVDVKDTPTDGNTSRTAPRPER